MHQHCSVSFKEKLAFKHKRQTHKVGHQTLCTVSATNEYIESFQFYTVKTVERKNDVGLRTLTDYKHFSLHVYIDNYYSSSD